MADDLAVGNAIVYVAGVAAWIGGIAVGMGQGVLIGLGCVLLPPIAWILLAMHLVSKGC